MKPNITLEKLQLLVTRLVKPEHKIQWLEWWISKPLLCESLKFPPTETSNLDFHSLATQAHILSTSTCFLWLSSFPFTLSVVNRYGELDLVINHTASYLEGIWTQKSKLLVIDLYVFESFFLDWFQIIHNLAASRIQLSLWGRGRRIEHRWNKCVWHREQEREREIH
jgi:hypothetical protein